MKQLLPLIKKAGLSLLIAFMLTPSTHTNAQTNMVGSLGGEVAVSSLGTATYSIPIEVVPGTKGVQPNLAVTYNSAMGRGMLGTGWTLTGLSSITRIPQTNYFDNNTGAVNFDWNDRFALDGQRLVRLAQGAYMATGAVYGTETENFVRVTLNGTPNTDGMYFSAVDNQGTIIEYGEMDASRLRLDHGGTLAWMADKVTDADGNYMRINYERVAQTLEVRPYRIGYTKNTSAGLDYFAKVDLEYIADPNANKTYVGGDHLITSSLLSRIKVIYDTVLVRQYVFEYSYDRSTRLTAVVLKDGSGNELTRTSVTWNSDWNRYHTTSVCGTANYTPVIGDYNGDNRPDLFLYNKGPMTGWLVLRGDGNGHYSDTLWAGIVPGYKDFSAVDLEGDGRDEVTYTVQDPEDSDLFYLKAIRFLPNHTTVMVDTNDTGEFLLGNFTGEGGVQSVRVGEPSNGQKTVTLSSKNVSFQVGEDDKLFVTDLNGNGKSDIQVTRENYLDVYEYDQALGTFVKIRDSQWFDAYPTYVRFGDLNGDGCMDFIYYSYKNGAAGWFLKMSKGNDYTSPVSLPLNGYHGSHNTPVYEVLVSDINGDGKDDIIQPVSYLNGPADLNVYYSRAYSDNGYLYNLVTYQINGITTSYASNYRFADLNGDGKNEMVYKSFAGNDCLKVVDFPERRMHDLVASVTNGLLKTTSLEFLFCNSPKLGGLGSEGRRVRFPLVSRVTRPDGVGSSCVTAYSYGNAIFNYDRGQFLGYQYFKAACNGTSNIQYFKHNEDYRHLALEQSLVYLDASQNNPVGYVADPGQWTPSNGILYHYETYNTPKYQPLGYGRFIPYDSVSSAVNRLENMTTTTSVWLNAQGRVVSTSIVHKTDQAVNSTHPWTDRDSTVYTYTTVSVPNGSTAVRIHSDTTWGKRNGFTQQPFRAASYTYDNAGRLASVTRSDSDGEVGVTAYTYNSLGLPLTETLTPYGMAPRTRSFGYDGKGRFPIRETDPLGHVRTSAYDKHTGLVSSETDANGLTTSYEYDALGRLTRTTRPDLTHRDIAYFWSSHQAFPEAVWFTRETETGTPETRTYYDVLGRVVHTYNAGQGYHDRKYDARGRLKLETSVPYESPSEGADPDALRLFQYDNYDRVVSERAPYTDLTYSYSCPGSVQQTTHSDTVTDNIRGVWRSKTYDASGRLTEARDAGGSVTYGYAYQNESGSIRDALSITVGNSVTTVLSDIRGNRLRVQDPDAGTVASTYDVLGQLCTRTDANGVTTAYTYDLAGRVLEKAYSVGNDSETVTYDYDPAHGVGKVASVRHDGSKEHEYFYDTLGRLCNHQVFDGHACHEHLYQYDTLGRFQYLTYPDGFRVRYAYNSLGELSKVRNAANDSLIYSIDTRDALGQPLKCMFGNNTGAEYFYNRFGLLTGIHNGNVEVGSPSQGTLTGGGQEHVSYTVGTQYRNLAYTYDSRGFIHSRSDADNLQSETYTYDNLDRLVSYTVNGNQTVTHTYSSDGNITSSSRLGSYGYSSNKPHAVRQLPSVPSGASPMPSPCDAAYNLMNMPSSLSANSRSVTLDYDAYGMRRHTTYYQGQSLDREKTRVSDLFELEGNKDNNRRLDYIYADGRVVAVRVLENGIGSMHYVLTDHLGSWERVLDGSRNTVQMTHFDPWGNRMGYTAWDTPQTVTYFTFDRGFTGHEHYDDLGVINANARIYDPVIGRFFSPDPFVQAPDFTQSFNRYSYCMNNPVMFSDEDGEWVHIVVGAVAGGLINLGAKAIQGQINSFWDGVAAFGIGAVAGAVGAATGGAAFLAAGGAAAGAGGFIAGAGGAMMSTAFSSPIQSIGNAIYFNDPLLTPKEYAIGVGISGIIGGAINGGVALYNGRSFLTGDIITHNTYQVPPKPSFKIDTHESSLNTEGLKTELKLPQNTNTKIFYLENAKYCTKEVDGLRITLRDPYFRKNLINVSGINPGNAAQAHHVFPLEYASFFESAGINPNSYGAWWGNGHLQNAYQYNQAWKQFFTNNPNANQQEIYNFALQLIEIFNY